MAEKTPEELAAEAALATEVPEAPKSTEERLDAVEEVMFDLIDKLEDMGKKIENVAKNAVSKPKGKFGEHRARTPMKDLVTGTVYLSKAAVGKKFAIEVGGDPADTFVYYVVEKKLAIVALDGTKTPRFVPASAEEGAAVIKKHDDDMAAEIAESNRLQEIEDKKIADALAGGAAPVVPTPAPGAAHQGNKGNQNKGNQNKGGK